MNHIAHTFAIVTAAIREQIRAEKAFPGNFWFGLLSRVVYNVIFLIFIDVLFKRIGTVAGWTHNDFLFLYFVSQVGFYVTYACINQAMVKLLQTVRTGNFDLLLLKPVPHRTFLYINGQEPTNLAFTLITTLPLVASQISWADIHIGLLPLLLGVLVFACGIIICNTLIFALTLPAFKMGDATDMLNVFYSITATSSIPYSKLPGVMKLLSLTVLPHLVISAAAAEVMLQKSDTMSIVIPVIIATIVSMGIFQFSWRWALRNYTSASS